MTNSSAALRRVAFVLTQDRGGPVDVTVQLAAAVHETGSWEVRVFGPPPARDHDLVAGLHSDYRVEGKAAIGAIKAMREAIRAWRPSIVHAQDRRSGLVCAGLHAPRSSSRPMAVVHTYHGVPDDVSEPWFRSGTGPSPSAYTRAVLAADSLVARAVSRTVVPSASMGRFLTDRLRVPAARVVHVDNGLRLPPANVPNGPVRRLLFVGLLVRRKGVHLLLDAMAAAALPEDVTLQVAGDGPERDALAAQAARLGLQSRVHMLGFRPDVPELLHRADAFVLPSLMEQQPLVLIEALGAGKPVIATDVGGVRDMVSDVGLLVPPADASALAAALERLTASDDASALGASAADLARRRFTVGLAAQRHQALYEQLLAHEGEGS